MNDREKVINGLEHLSEWLFQQYRVVYDGDAPNYYDAYKTVDEALALLKKYPEREKVVTGLKCCLREISSNPCGECPYNTGEYCGSVPLLKDALKLLDIENN